MRPKLEKGMKVQEFKEYYWLKQELQSFCRDNKMSASGSKAELSERIEVFIQTGVIKPPIKRRGSSKVSKSKQALNVDTVITENHRCSQEVRAFFKQVIGPKFHFSTYIQSYFKNNIGKTYRDAVAAWFEEDERKKSPTYEKIIAPQFEYNQYIRDFFADENNKCKSHKEAIAAWNESKKLPGSNKYRPN